MSRYSLTAETLRTFLARHPGYDRIRTFVETGTYLGHTTAVAAGVFAEVHSVEISAPLFKHAKRTVGLLRHVHLQCGDSREFVADLAQRLEGPVLWFLDAHWFKHTRHPVGGQAEGLPLWDELAAIAGRPAGDLVVIDDVHVFGRREPTPEWEDVRLETIAAALEPHGEAAILGPHAVIYR
jgi:hypothetical protein